MPARQSDAEALGVQKQLHRQHGKEQQKKPQELTIEGNLTFCTGVS